MTISTSILTPTGTRASSVPVKSSSPTDIIAHSPQESFTRSSPVEDRTARTVVGGALGGALVGLGAYYAGGDLWAGVKVGAAVHGTLGALVGGASGASRNAENPLLDVVLSAGLLGSAGALLGGTKGLLTAGFANAFGGGPIAYAACGAIFGSLTSVSELGSIPIPNSRRRAASR